MIHRADKNKNYSRNIIITFLVIVFLFIITSTRVFNNLNSLIHSVATPFWKVHNVIYTKFSNTRSIFYSNKILKNDNDYLKSQILELQTRLENQNIIQKENDDLKKILGKVSDEKPIIANIITWPRQSVYDVITIDMGNSEGIKVGNKIYSYDTAILGEVVEVYEHSSKINLYSTSGVKTTGIVEGSDTVVDLVGRGGGSFIINVPRDVVLTKGANILAPGNGNYVIAKIKEVITNDTDPLLKIYATSLVNINQIKSVLIEK